MDVECNSDFENTYDFYDELDTVYKQAHNLQAKTESDIIVSEEDSDSNNLNDCKLKKSGHSLAEEEKESEDELLLTTNTIHPLQENIDK